MSWKAGREGSCHAGELLWDCLILYSPQQTSWLATSLFPGWQAVREGGATSSGSVVADLSSTI